MSSIHPIDRFAQEYQSYHSISPERRRRQLATLREFEATLDGSTILEATQGELQAFAGAMLDRGLHVNTVRKHLNMIRPFFSWAFAVRLVSADQYLQLKSVRDPRGASAVSLPNPYAKAELQEFWAALAKALPLLPSQGAGSHAIRRWLQGKGPWRRVARHAMRLQVDAIVHLALDCGLRRGEIFRLSLDDLHYDNEYLVVTGAAKNPDGTHKLREVPFTASARQSVAQWLEFRALMRCPHSRPWVSCYGPLTYSHPMYFRRLEELLRVVVGPGWELQRFRHTCGTNWLRAGAALEDVSKLLGHASLQQTLGYAEITKGDLSKRLGKIEGDFEKLSGRAA